MSAPTTTLYFEDRFDREDDTAWGSAPDNGWAATAEVDLVDGAIVPAATATYHYVSRSSSASPHTAVGAEYVLTAAVAATLGSSKNQTFDLVARSEGSNIGTASKNRYMVQLKLINTSGTESATLAIKKVDSGGESFLVAATTVTEELNTSSASLNNVFQHIAMRVRDDADGVIVEAYLNDEERPRLTAEDNKYPSIDRGGSVGVLMTAGTSSDTFARVGSFAVHGIADVQESEQPVPNFFTFGKLKSILRARALRDSSSLVDNEFFGDLINEAQFELSNAVGRPYWLEDVYAFSTVSGTEEYELPADTLFVDDVVWDTTSSVPLPIISEEQFRREEGRVPSGNPTAFRLSGTGPSGGPLLKGYPNPSASKSYEIRRFRMPRYMPNDNDLPALPPPFAYALIWGALVSYSLRDSDRTHIQGAAARYQSWTRKLRHITKRREAISSKPSINSGLSGVGLGNTLWVQGRYGGWRWRS